MKTCKKCKEEKELSEFYKSNQTIDGLCIYCKSCFKEKRKKSYIKNKDKVLKTCNVWYKKNRNKMLQYQKEYKKEYRKNNHDINYKIKQKNILYYMNNKKEVDIFFNNKKIDESNVLELIKIFKKNKSIEKRKLYLENWKKDNFKNYYNNYFKQRKKIDPLFKLTHNIRSLINSSIKNKGFTKRSQTYKILGCTYEEFKIYLENQFTDGMTWQNQGKWHLDHIYPVSLAKDEEELIKLNHYTNFQPLWAEDNLKKSNKITQKKRTD